MSLKYAFPFDVHYSLILAILYILHTLIEHVLTFPLIYRAFLLSPEKHGKSGDYCNLKIALKEGSPLKGSKHYFEIAVGLKGPPSGPTFWLGLDALRPITSVGAWWLRPL